jgi:hypothetical protein
MNDEQITSLADEKTSAEDNASKAIALDHLGLFGARLRRSTVEAEGRAKKDVERKGIGLTLQEVSLRPSLSSFLNKPDLSSISALNEGRQERSRTTSRPRSKAALVSAQDKLSRCCLLGTIYPLQDP